MNSGNIESAIGCKHHEFINWMDDATGIKPQGNADRALRHVKAYDSIKR
jgi:hypothetical protein